MCRRAHGFSGRAMAKLMLNLQAAAFASAGEGTPVVTLRLLQEVLAREVVKQANQREAEEGGRVALPSAAVAGGSGSGSGSGEAAGGGGGGGATASRAAAKAALAAAASSGGNPPLAVPQTAPRTRARGASLETTELEAPAEEAPRPARGKTPSGKRVG